MARGRMQSRAMNKLRIRLDDGTLVDLRVDELGEEDAEWLAAAQLNPEAIKTEAVEPDGTQSPAADDEAPAER